MLSDAITHLSPWVLHTDLHALRFEPGDTTLVVTFDHLDAVFDGDKPVPWAFKFVVQNGWSILGIVSKAHVWFREEHLHDIMLMLKQKGFFDAFSRVVFAGGSKGGYGALAFSSLSPGSTVIAINPQSTLDIGLVPWETRYPVRKWGGRFIDGAHEVRSAERVHLFFDPFDEMDRRHAERIDSPNVKAFRCNFFEHGIATCFQRIGILKPVMGGLIRGDLSEAGMWRLYRARRKLQRVPRNMFMHMVEKDRVRLAMRICDSQIDGPDGRFFVMRKAMLLAQAGNFSDGHKLLRTVDSW